MDLKSLALGAAILVAVLVLVEAFTGWPLGQSFWVYGSAAAFVLYALVGLTIVMTLVLMERLARHRR